MTCISNSNRPKLCRSCEIFFKGSLHEIKAISHIRTIKIIYCYLSGTYQKGFLFLQSLEPSMAKFRSGIDKFQINLLQCNTASMNTMRLRRINGDRAY